jgi:hypothetical protein
LQSASILARIIQVFPKEEKSMSAPDDAITQATRLTQVGFAEFTSKMITDVFAALLDANLKQIAAYTDLVKITAMTLADFIKSASDSISLPEITAFLQAIGGLAEIKEGTSLDATAADKLNTATALPDGAGFTDNNAVAKTGALTRDTAKAILEAVANRIAANKYDLLVAMVRQGMLRLVVDNGVIESRLTFQTNGYIEHNQSTYVTTDTRGAGGGTGAGVGFGGGLAGFGSLLTGGALASIMGMGVGAGLGAGGMTNVTVTTTSSSERDVNGSSVQIYGRVEIRFKTDYVPLNP